MALDSVEIRREIRNILTKNGSTRGKELADQVIGKGIGSQKTVYREIKTMCDDELLERIEYNRGNVAYELRDISVSIEKRLKFYEDVLNEINDALNELNSKMNNTKIPLYINRLFTIVTRIKQLQKVETSIRIYGMFPVIRKSRHFTRQKKTVEELWKFIFEIVSNQPEEKFLQEMFMNFTPVSIVKVTSYKS